ncbi:hypothetical protein C2E20_0180 [Micractinium conductrix]|uniref:Uncharacterized protein n=1 Tax=Micractinium conductrix TaxID=554055 RepID=A0A2P6VQN5_9CHLO|nr:hypothetical protein C2E20_0180 [Micractinium conductrix]|eukprot:PSC76380.1 hypothetical protein C2E20_0180 [Micractinium conductrix]
MADSGLGEDGFSQEALFRLFSEQSEQPEQQAASGAASASPAAAAAAAAPSSLPPAERPGKRARLHPQGYWAQQLGESSAAATSSQVAAGVAHAQAARAAAGGGRGRGRGRGRGHCGVQSTALPTRGSGLEPRALPGDADAPAMAAMQDREDQAHKGSRSTLNGKYDMVDFFLFKLHKWDPERKYVSPSLGTDLGHAQDGPKLAINAWRWARDGFPHFFLNAKEELGLKQDRKPPESLTWGYLSSFHTALSHKYKAARQTANPDIAILKEPLLQFESYKDSYDAARRYLTGGKGHVNLEGADPQAGTHADTEYADFVAVIRLLVLSGKLVDAREASEFAMMQQAAAAASSPHQPHLTHMLGAMAGAAAVQPQLSAGVHNRFLSLTSGAAMVPSSAIGGGIGPGSGGGGGDGSGGSGAGGGGGKRKMASQRPLPALSWFDKNGGLVALWKWYTTIDDDSSLSYRDQEEQCTRGKTPAWRQRFDKRRWQEVKKLLDFIQGQYKKRVGTREGTVSEALLARILEEERGATGFTTLVKQLQRQAGKKGKQGQHAVPAAAEAVEEGATEGDQPAATDEEAAAEGAASAGGEGEAVTAASS